MESVAIIGIGCRFPSAKNPEFYWHLLSNGMDAITEIPSKRWNHESLYFPRLVTPGKISSRWGSFLKQVDCFDSDFFGISSQEAKQIDPQQRLILEVAWEALENAGLPPEKLTGSQTGVFIGISSYDYHKLICQNISGLDVHAVTGTSNSIAANRLSHLMDLHGPSVAVDTACSSSLTAVHLACQSLKLKETNLCIVGGVNLILTPEVSVAFSQTRVISADGRCKAFDASANGYARGEGCGVLVLKRLEDALKDQDNIQAIIRGSAINQNGLSNGLTGPNRFAQQRVISQALKNSEVEPNEVSYIEAHGSGTILGDSIEFLALKEALMQNRSKEETCWLSSVKTNVGHLEAAAGMASLIKVILSLQHKCIPPHLHLKKLNPHLSFEGTTFSIPTKRLPWSVCSDTRIAGINAFGLGGANCHIILEEASVLTSTANKIERPLHLLTLSAKSETALHKLTQRYIKKLNPTSINSFCSDTSLADICFTANTGRSHFNYRLAIFAESNIQLRQKLEFFENKALGIDLVHGEVTNQRRSKIAFLFTGEGSQYTNMGHQMYETHPTFCAVLEKCDDILQNYLDKSLFEILYSSERHLLDSPAYKQPILFALEYALFQVWQSWGIKPDVVVGYGIGEYVAACISGVFSLEDGLKIVSERGRLIEESLQNDGIETKFLNASSASIKLIQTAFKKVVDKVKYSPPQIDLICNTTGELVLDKDMSNSDYWVQHLPQPMKYISSFKLLNKKGYKFYIEVGPRATMANVAYQKNKEENEVWLPTLNQDHHDWKAILQTLQKLYVQGVKINWSEFDRPYNRHRTVLPTYPFQRKRYWIETSEENTESIQKQKVSAQVNEKNEFNLQDTKKGKSLIINENALLAKIDTRTNKSSITQNLQKIITQYAAYYLNIDPKLVDSNRGFFSLGFDSLTALELIKALEKYLEISISETLLFEYPTIAQLAKYLIEVRGLKLANHTIVYDKKSKSEIENLNVVLDVGSFQETEIEGNQELSQHSSENNKRTIGKL